MTKLAVVEAKEEKQSPPIEEAKENSEFALLKKDFSNFLDKVEKKPHDEFKENINRREHNIAYRLNRHGINIGKITQDDKTFIYMSLMPPVINENLKHECKKIRSELEKVNNDKYEGIAALVNAVEGRFSGTGPNEERRIVIRKALEELKTKTTPPMVAMFATKEETSLAGSLSSLVRLENFETLAINIARLTNSFNESRNKVINEILGLNSASERAKKISEYINQPENKNDFEFSAVVSALIALSPLTETFNALSKKDLENFERCYTKYRGWNADPHAYVGDENNPPVFILNRFFYEVGMKQCINSKSNDGEKNNINALAKAERMPLATYFNEFRGGLGKAVAMTFVTLFVVPPVFYALAHGILALKNWLLPEKAAVVSRSPAAVAREAKASDARDRVGGGSHTRIAPVGGTVPTAAVATVSRSAAPSAEPIAHASNAATAVPRVLLR